MAGFIHTPPMKSREIIQRCANSPVAWGGVWTQAQEGCLELFLNFTKCQLVFLPKGFYEPKELTTHLYQPHYFCVFSHLSQCTVQIKTLVQQLVSKCKTLREFFNKSLSALDNRCHVHFKHLLWSHGRTGSEHVPPAGVYTWYYHCHGYYPSSWVALVLRNMRVLYHLFTRYWHLKASEIT